MNDDLIKVTVGLPSSGNVRVETAASLTIGVASTKGVYFHLSPQIGVLIHENREQAVLEAQKERSTHLLFVDSDIAFPADAIQTLLSRNKPIIGADYHFRQLPLKSVTIFDPKKFEKGKMKVSKDPLNKGKKVATIDNPNEPFECRSVGAGFLLIQMWVFDKIKRPWFFYRPSADPDGMIGEDVWFCDRAREAKIGVWCDPTIKIDHIGTTTY